MMEGLSPTARCIGSKIDTKERAHESNVKKDTGLRPVSGDREVYILYFLR